jgi:hypothetical protein
MKGSNAYKFVLYLYVLIILRILDLYTTFIYTKDLNLEWNPIVSLFGSGWGAMITVQGLVILLIAFFMYFYFFRHQGYATQKGLSFSQYISWYFFRTIDADPKERIKTWNKYGMLVFNGFVLMWAAIGVSLFAVIHNIFLIRRLEGYTQFVAENFTPYFVGVFIVIGLLAIVGFYLTEYLSYRRRLGE